MKQPEDCLNIEDIRTKIDNLDREIITALGKRFKYIYKLLCVFAPLREK
ncbi:MAG: hypothetical protein ACFCU5_04480 [Pleurocapsa sp.]